MADTDDDIEKTENLPEDPTPDAKKDKQDYNTSDDDEYEEEKGTEVERHSHAVHYNSEDYISGPKRVENGTVPMNIIEFHHSYAYDCQRYFNLCVADPNTIIFASGNLINFFNVSENTIWFRRGSTGGGIGHITKNPMFNHIAVGENGIDPPIIIYEWPSMEIVTILFEGTTRCYSHLAYSPDGLLMVSQGGDPDYLITIWNWQKSKIMLRCKSHGQDIYNVMFSPSVPGHLTSSGSGHIKFWKMAKTFTGLKLKGEIGRFGKTEISDIIGVYPMPDEKVVSSCEWGNILLWDEGLIKLEVCKKNRKTCHNKLITQFEYSNGELMSVGMDGWIRIWFYETIDQADPPDDVRFVEIEPIYEFHITEEGEEDIQRSSMLMSIQKQQPDDPEQTFWYAQDGNGGLWLIDLCTLRVPEHPRKILTCHAGPITDMDVATWGPFVATCGKDAHLHIYNYFEKKLILVHKFRDVGSKVIWFPCTVEATGSTLVCAFESGIIRMITVAVLKANLANNIRGDYVRLIQIVKPHTKSITCMSLNDSHSLLVTGSEDATIFVFYIRTSKAYPILVPIGYVKIPSGATCITWKPEHQWTILVGCLRGDCAEVELPNSPQEYTTVTYELVRCEPRFFKFQSVKSTIRRELADLRIQKKKETKIAKKREEMERLRADNPGIEIDEEAFLMDSEEDPPLPEIYIPKVPNQVLMANYTAGGTIWLSMAGFDAGYIYEYPIPLAGKHMDDKPIQSTVVFDADDIEIRSCLFYKERKYLFLGMEHGQIRVCRVNSKDHTDFSDYWILSMHDNYNGYIPKMLLSHDRKMLLTCGHDGNLFSFLINDDTPDIPFKIAQAKSPLPLPLTNVEDIEEPDYPSLEEVIVKAEHNRIMKVAKQKKDQTLKVLRELTEEYGKIVDRNRNLLKSQQISQEEFELDPRITADLNHQLQMEMNLMHRKLAFKVEKSKLGLQKLLEHFIEPITCLPFAVRRILKPHTMVQSLRERKLGNEFTAACAEVARRISEIDKAEAEPQHRQDDKVLKTCDRRPKPKVDVKAVEETKVDEEQERIEGIESFLKGLSPSTIQYRLGVKINQMLKKYRTRRAKLEERRKEWKAIHANKPDPTVNHPDDVIAIKHAKTTIGDYKLKMSPDFSVMKEKRENTLTKYKQFLECKKKAHYLRENFNDKLRAVRSKKQALIYEVLELVKTLKNIHAEIPEERIKPLPAIPTIDYDVEFPEKNLELEKYTSMAERVKEAKREKISFVVQVIANPMDEEYEILLLDEKTIHWEQDSAFSTLLMKMPEKRYKTQTIVHRDVLQTLTASDHIETPWECEMKRARVVRKIYEQECILKHVETSYEELDKELDELETERLEIAANSIYIELFLLTLHQELIVLKDFEAMENLLTAKVNEKLEERIVAKQKTQAVNVKIEQKNKDISKLQDKIKDIFSHYMSMINENKFRDFLKRIFKKKYKPPKGDDESTSSSSSTSETSSEDDDIGSIDSQEIGLIHFDESICPPGCDKELYDTAFSMREQRYKYEIQIKEEQKAIELFRKEVDNDVRKLKVIENNLKRNQEDLEVFMREKQRKLNDIDMTVILKFHQLQHFVNSETTAKIRDCVVFDKTKLFHLYVRVGELQQETLEQKTKHKKNTTHLQRMKVDCKHMEMEIKKLKDDIKQEMIRKFGQEISLNVLYNVILRKMIYDIKINMNEMTKSFDEEIKCVKNKYVEQLDTLQCLIQSNTEKLSFLTVLENEQLKLRKILKHVSISEEEILRTELEYQGDLLKLENVLKSQEQQKELFRNEIKNLSLKSRPLPPICLKQKSQKSRKAKYKESDEAMLTVIDVKTGEGYTIDKTHPKDEDEESEENEVKEIDEDGNEKEEGNEEHVAQLEEYKDNNTAMMVHRLLSRIIEVSLGDEGTEEGPREILKELISNLPLDGSREELRIGIERSVENIVATLPQVDEKNVKVMQDTVREILTDIIFRLDTESKKVSVETETTEWKIKRTLGKLIQDVGIKESSESLENVLIQLLREENGVQAAAEHLLANLSSDTNEETRMALFEHVTVTLTEIAKEATQFSEKADQTESTPTKQSSDIEQE